MTQASYNQFCPIAMAAEILCTRWTMVLVRELIAGSTRFNDLRRGLPRMSPALLSKRLKELEQAGLVKRTRIPDEPGAFNYQLTDAGRSLEPIVVSIGAWGQRWIETEATLKNLDVGLLMWDMRRNINVDPMPRRRSVIQVMFSDLAPAQRNWWLVVEPGMEVDLCSIDPGFDVDLYLSTNLRTMTEIWMGLTKLERAKREGRITLTGNPQLEAHMGSWLMLSPFARPEKRVA